VAEKLLNIHEAATLLSLSAKDVEELVNEGRIPAFHLDGKYLRFRRDDLLSFRGTLSRKKGIPVEKYSFRDGVYDFFYFNDFYLISLLLIFGILYGLLKM